MTTKVPAAMLDADIVTQDELDIQVATLNANIAANIVDAAHLSSTLDLSSKTLFMPATAMGAGAPHIILEHQAAIGTHAGTLTAGAANVRPITHEVRDVRSECTLAANQIVLTAGTYYIEARVPSYRVDGQQAYLYNVTGAAVVLAGCTAGAEATLTSFSDSIIMGTFTVAAAQTLEFRQNCITTRATDGMGRGFGGAPNGGIEKFLQAKLWRIA